ncbi:class I adenylate-forming enzyme family protein [soil metagenome]
MSLRQPPNQNPIRRERHFGTRVLRCFADRPLSLYAMLEGAVRRRQHHEALVCGAQRLSWHAFGDRVTRMAYALAQKGVGAGDRVCLLLGNRIEFVEAAFAVTRLGAIFVPISVREQTPGIAHIVNDCGAVLLIHEAELRDRLPAGDATPTLRECVVIGDAMDESGPARSNLYPDVDADFADAAVAVHEDDTAAILYTSGTTGKPKGAMLSHLNIVHSAMHYESAFELSENDRLLAAVPLSHVSGLIALMATAVRCAGTLVIMPAFKAGWFLELAARERMSYTLIVPTMYKLCLIQRDCTQFDLTNWRIGAYGGAPMPESTINECATIWPALSLVNVYGATETTSPAAIMPPGQGILRKDSVGLAVACGEIVIMDDDGREVPAGCAGELWIKGPMVSKGYWENPEATAQGFVEGYWRSGDIGSIDEQGFIAVFDRKKDMINRGGFKIYSSEVENVLSQYPGILEAAVFGQPCPVLGERVHAHVVLREQSAAGDATSDVSVEAITAFCKERLTDYQVPESMTVSNTPLPRNANGKVLKRELRETVQPGNREIAKS